MRFDLPVSESGHESAFSWPDVRETSHKCPIFEDSFVETFKAQKHRNLAKFPVAPARFRGGSEEPPFLAGRSVQVMPCVARLARNSHRTH